MSGTHKSRDVGEVVLSLALTALGIFVVYETQSIGETQSYAKIGPRLFPYLIGAGLILCGAVLGWQAFAGGWRNLPGDQQAHERAAWPAFFTISAGVILHMVVIGFAGFIVASTLLFFLVARGFGSRQWARDLAIGATISTLAFLVFTWGLGLTLPRGPF